MTDTIAILQSLQPAAFDAGAVFSGTPSSKHVKGYAAPSLFTPTVDPNYIFHKQSRDIVVWFIDTSESALCLRADRLWQDVRNQATRGQAQLPGV